MKPLWQIPLAEWMQSQADGYPHGQFVSGQRESQARRDWSRAIAKAMSQGLPVPRKVRDDYVERHYYVERHHG